MALKQVFKTVLILFSLIIGLYALYTFSYKGGADALGISVDPSYKCRTASFLKELWGYNDVAEAPMTKFSSAGNC